jgi:hypothetical protein
LTKLTLLSNSSADRHSGECATLNKQIENARNLVEERR